MLSTRRYHARTLLRFAILLLGILPLAACKPGRKKRSHCHPHHRRHAHATGYGHAHADARKGRPGGAQ